MKNATLTILVLCLSIISSCGGSSDDEVLRSLICAIAAEDESAFLVGNDSSQSAYTMDAGVSFVPEVNGLNAGENILSAEYSGSEYWISTSQGRIASKVSLSADYNFRSYDLSVHYRDMDWPTSSFGIVVGTAGNMLVTDNGGASFVQMVLPDANHLNGVSCYDASNCYAVGDGGAVYRTSDGAKSWNRLELGFDVPYNLNGVDAFDAQYVGAVGDSGTYVTSFDNGATWAQNNNLGTSNDLNDLYYRSGTAGIVVGDRFAARTLDAGASFQSLDAFIEFGVVFKTITKIFFGEGLYIGGSGNTVIFTPDYGDNLRLIRPTFLPGEIIEEPESIPSNPTQGPLSNSFEISDMDFSFSHFVGTTVCPQKIGEFVITNTGNTGAAYAIESSAPVFADPSGGFTLEPGESRTIMLFFDCSQTNSFDSVLTVTSQGRDSAPGEFSSVQVQVSGSVN